MNNEISKSTPLTRSSSRSNVKLGEWRWVDTSDEGEAPCEELMCAFHLASNHVEFHMTNGDGRSLDICRVRYRDLDKLTRLEPDWQRVLQKKIADKQSELQSAVAALIDVVKNADLLDDGGPVSMLPATTRRDPGFMKNQLVELKEKKYPAAHENVEAITRQLVGLNKDLCMTFKAEAARMDKAVETVDKRLFALELYAGIGEGVVEISSGKPANPETPVTVRQMIRYMDEESLIDYDKGGMDFDKVEAFDEWVARPENRARFVPEPRCVVAMQVRRHDKDYGECRTIGEAFAHAEWNQKNKWTYLLIRNGERLYRLFTEIDFSPRLLPFRDEFVKPLEVRDGYDWKKHEDRMREVGPDDLDYDEVMGERLQKVYECNRVMFLLQGLLDRSKVFAPHPPINLGDESHVDRYFKPVFDEECGLPSANPPVWEKYRDKLNQTIRKGSWAWCVEGEEVREIDTMRGSYTRPKYGYDAAKRPTVCRVGTVSKDRKRVLLVWDLGDSFKTEWVLDRSRPVPNKPGWFYQKPIEHPIKRRTGRQWVDMDSVFAVEAYTPGDYKKFLCDAYLKGAYLKWAPQLLAAEKWHMDSNKETKE